MDSVTQIALGATVAASVGFKPFGRKVLLVGAFLATVPDLDIFIDYGNSIDNYTSHRGFSHSVFILTLLSIALYLLAIKLHSHFKNNKLALFLVIFLPLITHPLLDTFTSYGTQLLWPLTSPPIAWHSIFIIYPLYTLPLLITMFALWFSKNNKRWLTLNLMALFISSSYLAWGQFSQANITARVKLDKQVENSPLLVMPTPFNTLYWRILSYQNDNYYEAFTYLGDKKPLQWTSYKINRHLVENTSLPSLQRLQWFSHGWLSFEQVDDKLQVTDIRLGLAGYHPFTFAIADKDNQQWQSIEPLKVAIDEQKQQKLFDEIKEKVGL